MITSIGEVVSTVNSFFMLFGNLPFWANCIIVVVIFYLLLALFTMSLLKPLKFLGVPSMVSGIVFVGLRFAAPVVVSGAFGSFPEAGKIVNSALGTIIDNIMYGGIICFGGGLVLVIVHAIINRILKKKKKAKEITIMNINDVIPDEKTLEKVEIKPQKQVEVKEEVKPQEEQKVQEINTKVEEIKVEEQTKPDENIQQPPIENVIKEPEIKQENEIPSTKPGLPKLKDENKDLN